LKPAAAAATAAARSRLISRFWASLSCVLSTRTCRMQDRTYKDSDRGRQIPFAQPPGAGLKIRHRHSAVRMQ
jgi:hypothetical protein